MNSWGQYLYKWLSKNLGNNRVIVAFQIRRNVIFLARIVHSQTLFGISINFTRRQSHEHKYKPCNYETGRCKQIIYITYLWEE